MFAMPDRRSLSPSEKRSLIGRMLGQGLSQAEVGRRLGLAKPTVSYHARRLGLPAKSPCARRYDWDEIQRAYDEGLSVRACAQRFGFSLCSWHEAVKRGAVRPRPRTMPIETLLVADRKQTNRSHLKQRLLSEGLKENVCERCGLREWRGKPLNMALHHVNGKGKDNRLSNLELLCPNCHAQTENFAGRNIACEY
jgi:transposase-like protein